MPRRSRWKWRICRQAPEWARERVPRLESFTRGTRRLARAGDLWGWPPKGSRDPERPLLHAGACTPRPPSPPIMTVSRLRRRWAARAESFNPAITPRCCEREQDQKSPSSGPQKLLKSLPRGAIRWRWPACQGVGAPSRTLFGGGDGRRKVARKHLGRVCLATWLDVRDPFG